MYKLKKNYVLILTSGGIDSTACICFYKKLKFNVEGIFFDYGQKSSKKEFNSLKKIAKHYRIKTTKIVVSNTYKYSDGVIPGRNAFLFFLALMNFKKPNGIIASGIHSGTNYYDCSQEFVNTLQTMIDGYTQGTIKLGTPFLKFNKRAIFEYCKMEKVPINLTYSCELGLKQPCGNCATCKDLKAIYDSKEQ